ncbi:MAG TPA: sigma factor, partial [Ktedonobacteraceae bacterium]
MNSEPFSGQRTSPRDQSTTPASTQMILYDYLQENTASLLGTVRGYVLRMGLATSAEVQDLALEIFQESIAEALTSAERFDRQVPPRAWLLGIVANVIKRRKVMQAKRF